MEIVRDLHPRCFELLEARRRHACAQIAEALERPGARPLMVGVYQKRNHCGGAEGKQRNLDAMIDAIRRAADQGVEVLAMPEMALQGYFTPTSGTVGQAAHANRDLADVVGRSAALKKLQDAACAAKMVIAFGFAERCGDDIYNAIGVIDADGSWLGVRRKNPLYPWDYELKSFREPDPSARSCVFRTRCGAVGISNCFDGEFPETIRQMRLEGVELLLWCNAACGDGKLGTSHRINHGGSHAQANGMWVAVANCVAPDTTGTSCIIAPTGEPLVILSPDDEQLGIAQIDLAWHTDWSIWRDRLWPRPPA